MQIDINLKMEITATPGLETLLKSLAHALLSGMEASPKHKAARHPARQQVDTPQLRALKDLPDDALITKKEVGAFLGVKSATTVNKLVKDGVIPKGRSMTNGGRNMLWRVGSIKEVANQIAEGA